MPREEKLQKRRRRRKAIKCAASVRARAGAVTLPDPRRNNIFRICLAIYTRAQGHHHIKADVFIGNYSNIALTVCAVVVVE